MPSYPRELIKSPVEEETPDIQVVHHGGERYVVLLANGSIQTLRDAISNGQSMDHPRQYTADEMRLLRRLQSRINGTPS